MPKFNVDEKNELFEPIEIIIDGKEYQIDKITQKMLDNINKTVDDKDDSYTLSKQLAIMLSVDQKEFKDTDIRKMSAVIRYITEQITKDIEENPTKNKSGK